MKERKYQRRDSKRCSKCGNDLEENRIGKQRYCKKCHADNMKIQRLSDKFKNKFDARSH